MISMGEVREACNVLGIQGEQLVGVEGGIHMETADTIIEQLEGLDPTDDIEAHHLPIPSLNMQGVDWEEAEEDLADVRVHSPEDIIGECVSVENPNLTMQPSEELDTMGKVPPQGCFQCSECEKTFIYLKSYERHTQICSSKATEISPIEGEELPSLTGDLGEKFSFVHYHQGEDQLYRCTFPSCRHHEEGGAPFKTAGGCRNHQLLLHASDSQKRFSCSSCSKRFASNQLRNKHQNLAHNKRFPCRVDNCDKVFSERTRLVIHSRTHSGEKPFVCEDCGFSCSQRDNLRLHKEFKHPPEGTQEKKFPCEVCSASFLTKSNLSRHLASHTDSKPFVCHECGKAFKDPWALRQHGFSHGPAEYSCKECDQSFTSPLYLSRHMVRKHPTDGVQPLTCHLCGRGFPLNHQLQEHIQAVHQQVKHCCPHCNQPIGRRSSVHRHIKKGRCRAVLPPNVLCLASLTPD